MKINILFILGLVIIFLGFKNLSESSNYLYEILKTIDSRILSKPWINFCEILSVLVAFINLISGGFLILRLDSAFVYVYIGLVSSMLLWIIRAFFIIIFENINVVILLPEATPQFIMDLILIIMVMTLERKEININVFKYLYFSNK